MDPQLITTVTEKGQVTIPVEVRRRLGIRPKDKISFHLEDGAVRLKKVTATLEDAYGAVTPLAQPEDFDARIREAKDARAERRASEA